MSQSHALIQEIFRDTQHVSIYAFQPVEYGTENYDKSECGTSQQTDQPIEEKSKETENKKMIKILFNIHKILTIGLFCLQKAKEFKKHKV